MPIIGLTDRGATFPQIGILRKGAPKPERGPGRDLDHFRFDTEDQDAAERFRVVYGDEPASVRCFLPFASVGQNFEAWQEHWTAGALQHRCDGQTCVLWLNGQRYSQQPKPCPHLNLPSDDRNRCKPAGRLKIIIPELRRLAYVTVLTGSIHDIMALQSSLEALEGIRGDLRGIPLILRRVKREISMPGGPDGKRRRMDKWLLTIEAAPTWVDLQLEAQQRAAFPMPMELLPAPAADSTTGEIVEASYTPADEEDAPEMPPALPAPPPAKKPPTRQGLLDRIAALTQEADLLDLEIVLAKPLDQMTNDQLTQHGKNLRAAIDKANTEQPAETTTA